MAEKLLGSIKSLICEYFEVKEKPIPTPIVPPISGIAFRRLSSCEIILPRLENSISTLLGLSIDPPTSTGPIFVIALATGPRLYEETEAIQTLSKLKCSNSWVCLVIIRYTASEVSMEDYSRYPCDLLVRFLFSDSQGIFNCNQNEEAWKSISSGFRLDRASRNTNELNSVQPREKQSKEKEEKERKEKIAREREEKQQREKEEKISREREEKQRKERVARENEEKKQRIEKERREKEEKERREKEEKERRQRPISVIRLSGAVDCPEFEKEFTKKFARPTLNNAYNPSETGPILVLQQASGPRFFEHDEVTKTLLDLRQKVSKASVCLVVFRFTAKEIEVENFSNYPCNLSVVFFYNSKGLLENCNQNRKAWDELEKNYFKK